jgi:hypothetical protein
MKLLKFVPAFLAVSVLYKPVREFLKRYKFGFYYLDTQDIPEKDPLANAMDLRGTPTHECVCGSAVWNLQVTFDNYEIGTYFLEMQCAECGSLATAPTPLDRETTE